MEPATVGSLLAEGEVRLAACGVETPRLDAELLMAHALGIDRGRLPLLLVSGAGGPAVEAGIDAVSAAAFRKLVRRRALREPVAYLTGTREFWSLDIEVTPAVLIPRPETEHLVEETLAILGGIASPRVADVGTGSGAIAVALAVERPDLSVTALDISQEALEVARRNALRHGVDDKVELVCGDLLEPLLARPLAEGYHAVASNPPYVSPEERDELMPEVRRYEPGRALYAARNGMDLIERLLPQAARALRPGGWLLLEVASSRAEEVAALMRRSGPWEEIATRNDYSGRPRVVRCRRAPSDKGQAHPEDSGR